LVGRNTTDTLSNKTFSTQLVLTPSSNQMNIQPGEDQETHTPSLALIHLQIEHTQSQMFLLMVVLS
jgi:hypothetical protein